MKTNRFDEYLIKRHKVVLGEETLRIYPLRFEIPFDPFFGKVDMDLLNTSPLEVFNKILESIAEFEEVKEGWHEYFRENGYNLSKEALSYEMCNFLVPIAQEHVIHNHERNFRRKVVFYYEFINGEEVSIKHDNLTFDVLDEKQYIAIQNKLMEKMIVDHIEAKLSYGEPNGDSDQLFEEYEKRVINFSMSNRYNLKFEYKNLSIYSWSEKV